MVDERNVDETVPSCTCGRRPKLYAGVMGSEPVIWIQCPGCGETTRRFSDRHYGAVRANERLDEPQRKAGAEWKRRVAR